MRDPQLVRSYLLAYSLLACVEYSRPLCLPISCYSRKQKEATGVYASAKRAICCCCCYGAHSLAKMNMVTRRAYQSDLTFAPCSAPKNVVNEFMVRGEP